MSNVGQVERKTQQRVIELLKNPALGWEYLGDWGSRENNRNIEPEPLRAWLKKQGHDDALVTRAIHELESASANAGENLYSRNRAVYEKLRYGVKLQPEIGQNHVTVWLIDWATPENNHFAFAEEVTVKGPNTKRPDLVFYVNGIALGVLELKRSTVSVAEGIRQNLDNQKKVFIEPFFSTMQLVMAGNDTEGLRYGTIETPQKYYLTWKEDSPALAHLESPLDIALSQLLSKPRFLELIHNFIVFDGGVKKLARHNQYFGVRAAQERIQQREGGIIWHTQGSGKSLTMVWLARWIREHVKDARVLLITDRTELDDQIEKVFNGVNEDIHRTTSGRDLITTLNAHAPWLICSLIHKFGGKEDGEEVGDIPSYVEEVKRALPKDFQARGDLFVFVDECHRTQSGELHKAMKAILPSALFIGFTGTPLLKADKQRSIEVFGRYIHTYKFDEAVKDGVVLDLRYEARDIDQNLSSPARIDQWFEAKTAGLNAIAKAQLKKRWGTLSKVFSSQDRLKNIVADIVLDFAMRDRLATGQGNAMLVCSSIFQACKFYELIAVEEDFGGKCAIVTSYKPSPGDPKGESTGEGLTEKLRQNNIYKKMLGDWFRQDPEIAVNRVEEFEKQVKEKFVKEPGQMKLLIVVDKLLTGFDAPSATYLYIDKKMQDHGLFQAICRVNRLDGDDKKYGYIIDYKDLFKSLEGTIQDYTSGAFDAYDVEDVAGLLTNRLSSARKDLDDALEAIHVLCEPVEGDKDSADYFRYFCATVDSDDPEVQERQRKTNEANRLALYKHALALIRAYSHIAGELEAAGYTPEQAARIQKAVDHYEKARTEVKLYSSDYIDLKVYEPAMRHLIDTYIRAEESEKVSAFDDLSLVQLIVERGAEAVQALPSGIRASQGAVAETIENNVRKLIIDESPINPAYYEKMSGLLAALIAQRKQNAIEYAEYLEKIVALTKDIKAGESAAAYPKSMNTSGKRALFDNVGQSEELALALDKAVQESHSHDWRNHTIKTRKVLYAIQGALAEGAEGEESDGAFDSSTIMEIVRNQYEY